MATPSYLKPKSETSIERKRYGNFDYRGIGRIRRAVPLLRQAIMSSARQRRRQIAQLAEESGRAVLPLEMDARTESIQNALNSLPESCWKSIARRRRFGLGLYR